MGMFLFLDWMDQNIWLIKASNMTLTGDCGQTSLHSALSQWSLWSSPIFNCDSWKSWN